LSIGVVTTGDDSVITVNLATDGTGAIISTLDEIAAAIAGDTSASALIDATVSGDGTAVSAALASTALDQTNGSVLAFESAEFGSRQTVEVNVLDGIFNTTAEDNTTESRRDTGVDIGATVNGQTAEGQGLEATVRNSILDASFHFNEANNLVGTTAAITITGGGSLFQIGQQVTSTGQIGIGIEAVNTARLGGISGKLYELGTGNGKSLLDVREGSAAGAELVSIIEEALDRISTLRGRLGAIQKNVIETNISTLGVALENISEARSEILDTDFAAETAALTKAQILNQSGISVLAIANQAPQAVLNLLG
jgi:flagellin